MEGNRSTLVERPWNDTGALHDHAGPPVV